jgi:hypothetical protein
MKYANGQKIAVGDRVKLWKKQHGTVVCSINTGEFTKEYPEADWSYLKSGIMVRTDGGELFHYEQTDEDFEPLPSGSAP